MRTPKGWYWLILFAVVTISNEYDHPRTSIPRVATLTAACKDTLPMEMAQLQFQTNLSTVYIYGRSDECYNCLYLPLSVNNVNDSSICVLVDTQHSYSIGYSTEKPFNGCSNYPQSTCAWQPSTWIIQPSSYHYNQYEHYSIHIDENKATLNILKPASNKYTPLYIAIGVIFVIIVSYNIYRLYPKDSNVIDDAINDHIKTKPKRVVSLDVFRGFSLIIMVFVNYGGGGYWWLDHSMFNN